MINFPKISLEKKAAELIIELPNFLLLLEHFGISLPYGDSNLEDLCKVFGVNPQLLLRIASLFYGNNDATPEIYGAKDAITLVDYLSNCHRYYLEEKYPQLQKALSELAKMAEEKSGNALNIFFNSYFNEVSEHLKYENEVVFPYIISLCNQTENTISKYSIKNYKERHNDIEEKLKDLANLIIKYLPNNSDQVQKRELLHNLLDFAQDLNVHSIIEETILIPLIKKIENASRKGNADKKY